MTAEEKLAVQVIYLLYQLSTAVESRCDYYSAAVFVTKQENVIKHIVELSLHVLL